ncbi:MAG TPA: chorismate mutase [Spirochaetia bacterium]|nr:chorismate mutase [Spirochaetia bacterium]
MDLETAAKQLEKFEDSIITAIIERAQYKANLILYEREPGEPGVAGTQQESLFELWLNRWEMMESSLGGFDQPEERPFQRIPFRQDLPTSKRAHRGLGSASGIGVKPENSPSIEPEIKIHHFESINLTAEIRRSYLELVPRICARGDDGKYGVSAVRDIIALKDMARRIHFGALYVAELKYRDNPSLMKSLIEEGKSGHLLQAITRADVEEEIVRRVEKKAAAIQTESDRRIRTFVAPDILASLYRDTIFPLTKRGEVTYLLNRPPSD